MNNNSNLRLLVSNLRATLRALGSVLGPFIALVAVVLFFGVADEIKDGENSFLTTQNFRTIAVSTVTVAVAALGMTVVIIAGGIDLSAGTAIALCATVLAWGLKEDVATFALHGDTVSLATRRLSAVENEQQSFERKLQTASHLTGIEVEQLRQRQSELKASIAQHQARIVAAKDAASRWSGWTPALAVCLCVLTGCVCGGINGLLVSYLRVVPFIVTLGTMMIYLGIAKHMASETTVRPTLGAIPDWIQNFTSLLQKALWFGLPVGVWLTLLLALGLSVILRYSVFGRYVFALGSNESTARLCGINVPLTKIAVYAFAGLFVGMAGVYQFSRLSVGNPTSGSGLELRIIAAVVIGGASLSGGRGSVLGTLSGAAIMAVITSGCTLLELKNPIQDVILGVIIIAAVCVDQFRQRRLVR